MAAILARLLRAEWRRARPHIRAGKVPPFIGFDRRLDIAIRPLLMAYYARGHADEVRRNRAAIRPAVITKDIAVPEPLSFPSNLQLAASVYAVDWALRRIRQRITTAVTRILYRGGMPMAVPISQPGTLITVPTTALARRVPSPAEKLEAVGRVFDKPNAGNIAEEEATRLHHQGQIDAALEAGKKTHRWVTEEGACEECLRLERMGPVPIGTMFYSAKHGLVSGAPLHAHCRCSLK